MSKNERTKKIPDILTALPTTKEDLLELELDLDPSELLLLLFQTAYSVETGKNNPPLNRETLKAMGLETGVKKVFAINGVLNTLSLNNLVTDIHNSVKNPEAQEFISATKIAEYIREMTQIKDVILETEKILRKAKSKKKIQQYRIVLHSLQRILNILYELLSKYIKDPKEIQQYLAKAEEENQRHLQEKNQNNGLFEKILSVIKDAMNNPKNDKLEQLISELNKNGIKDYLSNLLNDEILKNMMLINQFEIIKMLKTQIPDIFSQANLDRIRKAYVEGSKTKEADTDFLVQNILIPVGNFVIRNFTHVKGNSSLNQATQNKKAMCTGKVNVLIALFEYLNIPYYKIEPTRAVDEKEIFHTAIEAILPNEQRLFMDTNHNIPEQKLLSVNTISNLKSKEQKNYWTIMVKNIEQMKNKKLNASLFLCYYLQETKSSEFCYPVHYIGKNRQTLYTHVPYPENCSTFQKKPGLLNVSTYNNLTINLWSHLSLKDINALIKKVQGISPYLLNTFINCALLEIDMNSNPKKALQYIEDGLHAHPNSYQILYFKAVILNKADKRDEALQIARELAFGKKRPQYLEFKSQLRELLLNELKSNSDYHKITLDIFEIDPEYLKIDELKAAIKYFTDEINKLLYEKKITEALSLFIEIKQKLDTNMTYEFLDLFIGIINILLLEAKKSGDKRIYNKILKDLDIDNNFVNLIPDLAEYKSDYTSKQKLNAVITILNILIKPEFAQFKLDQIESNAHSQTFLKSIIKLCAARIGLFDITLLSIPIYLTRYALDDIEYELFLFGQIISSTYKQEIVTKNLESIIYIFDQSLSAKSYQLNYSQNYGSGFEEVFNEFDIFSINTYITLSVYSNGINKTDITNKFFEYINAKASLYNNKQIFLELVQNLIESNPIVKEKGEKFKQELLADFAKYTV